MEKGWNRNKRVIIAAACAAAVVTVGTMAIDSFRQAGGESDPKASAETVETVSGEMAVRNNEAAQPAAENAKAGEIGETPGYVVDGEDGQNSVSLTESQHRLVEILYEKMSENDRAGAAEHINKNEEQFRRMFEESLGGKAIFYDGETIKREAEGLGMVLRHPTTVFYGAFEGGAPEGECLAIKAMVLDYPRYDYSEGVWRDGLMEGKGKVGYDCYEGTDGKENPGMEKEGDFSKDLMNGVITYKTTNSDGVTLTWEMEAREGMTVLTDSWVYDESHDDYRLLSKNDDNRAFALKASEIDHVRWMNMIKWDE